MLAEPYLVPHPMNWLMYVSWLAGPLLQITLLVFMVRQGFRSVFPRFFYYIVFQLLKSAALFVIYRFFFESYFAAYWTGNAISVIFAVGVLDEILRSLFKGYGGIQSLGTTIFRWSCGLLLLLAILGAWSSAEGAADRIVAAVFTFDRSMRLIQVGIFLLLMLLCRSLKNYWRQPVFGLALGFGIFASIELILVSAVMWFGSGQAAIISLVKSTAYNAVTLLWIGYLRQQPELVPRVEPALNAFGLAFAGSASVTDADSGFMLRVEQAVDRVLSRSDWPRPTTEENRIVGRKPNPEEGN